MQLRHHTTWDLSTSNWTRAAVLWWLSALSLYEYWTSDGQWRTYLLCSGWIPREHTWCGFLSTDGTRVLGQGAILTPVRANQMPLLNNRDRWRTWRFKMLLSKGRVKIEHVFKEMKTYKAKGQIWRHPRWLISYACVCGVSCSFIWKKSETLEDMAKCIFNSSPQFTYWTVDIKTQ